MKIYNQIVLQQKEILEAKSKNEDTDAMVGDLLTLLMDNFEDQAAVQSISLPIPDIDTMDAERLMGIPKVVIPIVVMRFLFSQGVAYTTKQKSEGWDRFVALIKTPIL